MSIEDLLKVIGERPLEEMAELCRGNHDNGENMMQKGLESLKSDRVLSRAVKSSSVSTAVYYPGEFRQYSEDHVISEA